MATEPKLDADLSGEPIDQTDYYSKIESLMYLTSSRPDIVQVVCYCARYQARTTEKHLKESTLPTKGMRSIISTVSISLKDFMPSILLLMVIIVAVVIVTVIWVVIFVNVIVGVVIVVAIIGVVVVVGVPSIIDLSFVIIGWAYAFHQDKASSVKVPVANVTLFSSAHLLHENTDSVRVPVRLLGLLALAMAAVCASMAVVRSAISCRMASKVMVGVSDVDVLL
ncbi:hypothetical protein Tco_0144942 [Tanacetum coccineum]